jgi:hypothetical protein
MTDMPMLPINRLTMVSMKRAVPGSLLLASAGYGSGTFLAFSDPRDGDEGTYLLPVTPDRAGAHTVVPGASTSAYWLAIDKWRLEVDVATAFMGTQESPMPGDAFISDGIPGLMGRWNHADAFVSITGELLGEPRWGGGFVGFRNWSVVIDMVDGVAPVTVISHKREAKQP